MATWEEIFATQRQGRLSNKQGEDDSALGRDVA
jgi:hypothetical protein